MSYVLERLQRPYLHGPLTTRTGAFAGQTTLGSGQTSVDVAATDIRTDSLILMGVEASAVGSAFVAPIVVTSRNPGVGFVLGVAGNAALPQDRVISWLLIRT